MYEFCLLHNLSLLMCFGLPFKFHCRCLPEGSLLCLSLQSAHEQLACGSQADPFCKCVPSCQLCVGHPWGDSWEDLEKQRTEAGRDWSRKISEEELSHKNYNRTKVIVGVIGSGLTNWEPAAGELQEKTTAGQGKWCHSGKWEKALLEDQTMNIYFLKDFY